MAIGKNEYVTRSYVEGMIRHSSLGETAMLKDIQEKLNILGLDFDRLNERVESLEQGNNQALNRLEEIKKLLENPNFFSKIDIEDDDFYLVVNLASEPEEYKTMISGNGTSLSLALKEFVGNLIRYIQTGETE